MAKSDPNMHMQGGDDINASSRKKDHIELAFDAQVSCGRLDPRFSYEPILSAHPGTDDRLFKSFLGRRFNAPIWISSMTGGTEWAGTINRNLARACGEFGLGMGLGSCRALLHSEAHMDDFRVRHLMPDQALFANLGIAQVEQLVAANQLDRITTLLGRLEADGLIIHVNPMQEWLQPEGDHIHQPPIETISRVLDALDIAIIVKEVGQGMGYESLKALMQLPIAAVDFGANGGTNFAKLEMLRSDEHTSRIFEKLALIGHSADEMVELVNRIANELGDDLGCHQIIISGGVETFLDGYYFMERCRLASVYGQASSFLRHARGSYDALRMHVEAQIRGLNLADAFLVVKTDRHG